MAYVIFLAKPDLSVIKMKFHDVKAVLDLGWSTRVIA